jgi:protein-disulfide isomerase
MKRFIPLAFLFLFGIAPCSLWAEGITQEQGAAILEELKAIRKELKEIKQKGQIAPGRARPSRPTTAKVATLGSPILGDLKAPITMVEFTDYQCPFCRKFYSNAFKKLKEQYIDTGKLRLVLRDLPLGFHANARPSAKSAHCAGEQNKFWEMHDALFEGGGKLESNDLTTYAKNIGLDIQSFESCLHSERYKEKIDKDLSDARQAGITGTPSFVLGKTTDNFVQGKFIGGTRPFVFFQNLIDPLLLANKP